MTHGSPDTILYSSNSGSMTGGGQQSLLLLLKHLDRNRYKPMLICPGEGEFAALARSLSIETMVLESPRLVEFDFSSINKTLAIVKAHNVKIIHTDHPRQAFYFGLVARLARIPMIWHLRVGDRGNWFFERIINVFASKIIAVSGTAASRFPRQYQSGKKIRIINNAVDLGVFSPEVQSTVLRQQYGVGNKIVVGTMGQLLPRKGQEVFIRAAAEIMKTHKGKVLFIVVGAGTAAYTAYLKKLSCDLGLKDDIIFTGFRTDVPQVMASFDIFTLATTYLEGMSRVLIEAMASGKPVVATRIGGNIETVVDGVTGILVAPGDAASFAKATAALLDDADLRGTMGNEGRLLALQRFDIKKNVAATEMVYADLLLEKDK